MTADEKRKAVEALLLCCSGSEIGDLVDAVGDRALVHAYAAFLAQLSRIKSEAAR